MPEPNWDPVICYTCKEEKPTHLMRRKQDSPLCNACHLKLRGEKSIYSYRCRRCKLEQPVTEFPARNVKVSTVCITCLVADKRVCTRCSKSKSVNAFYGGSMICKACKVQAATAARRKRKAAGVGQEDSREFNTNQSDRLANTWDLGVLKEREQTAYMRGVWIGWKRGLDSYSHMGPGDGNLLAGFLSQVLASVELPEETKKEAYRAGRRLAKDYLVDPERFKVSCLASLHGEKAPDREGQSA